MTKIERNQTKWNNEQHVWVRLGVLGGVGVEGVAVNQAANFAVAKCVAVHKKKEKTVDQVPKLNWSVARALLYRPESESEPKLVPEPRRRGHN